MQNNRCIGPITPWLSGLYCARHSYGLGSKPIRGIFGNIFIELLFFVLLYKQKTTNAMYVNTNIISQHTHT